jgi:hypothetical protein
MIEGGATKRSGVRFIGNSPELDVVFGKLVERLRDQPCADTSDLKAEHDKIVEWERQQPGFAALEAEFNQTA